MLPMFKNSFSMDRRRINTGSFCIFDSMLNYFFQSRYVMECIQVTKITDSPCILSLLIKLRRYVLPDKSLSTSSYGVPVFVSSISCYSCRDFIVVNYTVTSDRMSSFSDCQSMDTTQCLISVD